MIGWKSSCDERLQFYGRVKLESPDFLALFELMQHIYYYVHFGGGARGQSPFA